jgi:CheY-like chemotaxis protein
LDKSGIDVIRDLRRRRPNLPVIGISGMMASGAFDGLLELQPPVECLSKPVMPVVLLGAVRRALEVASR